MTMIPAQSENRCVGKGLLCTNRDLFRLLTSLVQVPCFVSVSSDSHQAWLGVRSAGAVLEVHAWRLHPTS